jgi:hypothetical protein
MRPTVRNAVVAACLVVHLACLGGHARADMSLANVAPKQTDDPWIGIAAARRARVVAVWSRQRLMVSSDGGAHFRERLAGDDELDQVAVSPDGVVYALRGRRLGALRGARERWRRLGFDGFQSALVAGAGRVVWLGHLNEPPSSAENKSQPLIAVSADDGASWTFQRPSTYQELYLRRAEIDDRGTITIDVTWGDCKSYDGTLIGRVDGRRWRSGDERELPDAPPPPRDGSGRLYRIADDGYSVEIRDPGDPDFHAAN